MDRRELIGWFDRLNPHTGRMIQRDTEKYRKGLLAVKIQELRRCMDNRLDS